MAQEVPWGLSAFAPYLQADRQILVLSLGCTKQVARLANFENPELIRGKSDLIELFPRQVEITAESKTSISVFRRENFESKLKKQTLGEISCFKHFKQTALFR